MKPKYLVLALFLFGFLSISTQAQAAKLYAATAAGGPGDLYLLNPATGAVVQHIGPLNDTASVNYPITGLAFHPTTGVLYGSTGNNPEEIAARLVTIDPVTAQVTVIGSFNAGPKNSNGVPTTMADLAFDRDGNLYGLASIGGPNLYSIDLGSGQATLVGPNGVATSTSGGGLAISRGGVFYGTPTSSRFGTYNSTTGAYTNIGNPVKPVGGAYAALAFLGPVLYGLDLGPDSTGKPTQLVTINRTDAVVTPLGTGSLAQLDAIAFQIPEPGTLALLAIGLVAAGNWRRR